MNIVDLFEKRRNPEANTKTTALEELEKYRGRDDVFVSFTDYVTLGRGRPSRAPTSPKLGINPTNRYSTPTGIYTYPISYVLEKKGRVPFAGTLPYIWVVQSTGNLLDLCNYTEDDLEKDLNKLEDINIFTKYAREHTRFAHVDTPGGRLWYVLMKVAENHGHIIKSKTTTAWSKLIKDLGYSGAYDSCGEGIIHNAEPTQAFFVSRSAIKPLEVIHNDINKQPPRYSMEYLAKNPYTLFSAFDSGSLHFLEFANIVRDEISMTKEGNGNGWLENVSDYIGNNKSIIDKIASRHILLELFLPYLSSEHALLALDEAKKYTDMQPTMIVKIMNALKDRNDTHLYYDFLRDRQDFSLNPFEIISSMDAKTRLVFDDLIAETIKHSSITRMFYSLYNNVGPKTKRAIHNNVQSYARLAGAGIIPFNKAKIIRIINQLGNKNDPIPFWFALETFHEKFTDEELVNIFKANPRLQSLQFQEMVNMFYDYDRTRLKAAMDTALS